MHLFAVQSSFLDTVPRGAIQCLSRPGGQSKARPSLFSFQDSFIDAEGIKSSMSLARPGVWNSGPVAL